MEKFTESENHAKSSSLSTSFGHEICVLVRTLSLGLTLSTIDIKATLHQHPQNSSNSTFEKLNKQGDSVQKVNAK